MAHKCCYCGEELNDLEFWTHAREGSDPHCGQCYVDHAPHGEKGRRRAEVRAAKLADAEDERQASLAAAEDEAWYRRLHA